MKKLRRREQSHEYVLSARAVRTAGTIPTAYDSHLHSTRREIETSLGQVIELAGSRAKFRPLLAQFPPHEQADGFKGA